MPLNTTNWECQRCGAIVSSGGYHACRVGRRDVIVGPHLSKRAQGLEELALRLETMALALDKLGESLELVSDQLLALSKKLIEEREAVDAVAD